MKSYCFFIVILIGVALIGCARYRFPLSSEQMHAPGSQIWGVKAQKSASGFRTNSVTRLKGADPMRGKPTAMIASGTTGTWHWEVRAIPSLLPSLKAWQSNKEVQLDASSPDSWAHPAASWEQAFARAYKVVSYLMGRAPEPAKLTVLLIPKGRTYKKAFVETEKGLIPLTFAFYYPPDPSEMDTLTSDRFSALVKAVSNVVHEYQHALVDTMAIASPGKNETDRAINSEIRSQCWTQSAILALTSGTASSLNWNTALPDELIERSSGNKTSQGPKPMANNAKESPRPKARRYSDANLWAGHLLAQNVSAYLLSRGFPEPKVVNSQSSGMNAFLSVCRALTQRPRDLTAGPFPAARIKFVPFFPGSSTARK